MNKLLNNKWMPWIVIILMVLNVSALGTILYFTYKVDKKPVMPQTGDNRVRPGKEFIRELDLNPSQVRVFHSIRQDFFRQAKPEMERLREKRKIIAEGIAKDNPDTLYLDAVADTLGQIQADLKKKSMRHYMRIRKICNNQQKARLSEMFTGMFMTEEQGKGPGMGMGAQHRRGRQQIENDERKFEHRGQGRWRQYRDSIPQDNIPQ